MFCNKCGEEYTKNARFCVSCGEAIPKENTTSPKEQSHGKDFSDNDDINDYYAAAIGYNNTDYYLSRFKRFDSGGSSVSWHWPAFFVTFYWFLYRKMWLWALIYFLLPIPVGIFSGILGAFSAAAGGVAYLSFIAGIFIVFPMFATKLYHRHIRKKIEKAKSFSNDKEKHMRTLAVEGGTSNIALIIVLIFAFVAMIGILAAVAIPAYQDYTIRAKVSQGLAYGSQYKAQVEEYAIQNQQWPESSDDINISENIKDPNVLDIYVQNGVVIIQYAGGPSLQGKSLALVPSVNNENYIVWKCETIDLKNKYLPSSCRN